VDAGSVEVLTPTTGGSTSGNRIRGRVHRTIRDSLRANTSAIGTPSTMHKVVLAKDVLRLSFKAVNDEVLVINDQNCGQSTLAATATSGSTTKIAPAAAGR